MGTDSKRLTISIDFGTTYSGVAYSHPGDEKNEPLLVKDWGSGPTSAKVPTVLRYNGSDRVRGAFGTKWGFEVKHHERRQEWFKLSLDPMIYRSDENVDFGQLYPNMLADPPDYSRSAKKLCTDYLTQLKKQAWKTLEGKYTVSALKTLRIDWVITVPAVWSSAAKEDTLQCARDAGIGAGARLTIVSEPEAAAAYALQAVEPMNLKHGDNFVVCDAGGGTVDLITYRLKNLKPLEVAESVVPSGGKCGGVFVNRIFEKMILDRIGANSGLTDLGKHLLLQQFEQHAKREFSATVDPLEEWYLPASGAKNNAAAGISGGSIAISVEDMKAAFDPVVNEVIKLVKHQISGVKGIDNVVKAVVLVGGFGESRYLQQRIREAISPVELITPLDQWGAVALGAVIQGISTRSSAPNWSVSTRKASCHMGIEVRRTFNSAVHDIAHREWDACEGEYKCSGLLSWFVNKNDDLSDSQPRVYRFYRHVKLNDRLKLTEELLYSLDNYAPGYYNYDSCRDHSTLKVDLTPIKDKLEKVNGKDGQKYLRVDFEILATFHSAHVDYQWRCMGEVYDKVKCTYIS